MLGIARMCAEEVAVGHAQLAYYIGRLCKNYQSAARAYKLAQSGTHRLGIVGQVLAEHEDVTVAETLKTVLKLGGSADVCAIGAERRDQISVAVAAVYEYTVCQAERLGAHAARVYVVVLPERELLCALVPQRQYKLVIYALRKLGKR